MNTAEELLKRAVLEFEAFHGFQRKLKEEIREYLATPRTEQEPVIAAQCNAMHNKWPEEKKEELEKVLSEIRTEQEPDADIYDRMIGVEISMDVSVREEDVYDRIFGEVIEIQTDSEGNVILIAGETSRNFLHPAPKRKPLTKDEIRLGCVDAPKAVGFLDFEYGVRWAEKMHKIGEGDE